MLEVTGGRVNKPLCERAWDDLFRPAGGVPAAGWRGARRAEDALDFFVYSFPGIRVRPERPSADGRDLGDWHRRTPGSLVFDTESRRLGSLLANVFGYHLLLLGSSDYLSILHAARVQHCTWLMAPALPAPTMPVPAADAAPPCSTVRGLAGAMPVASDSVDIVVLPHVLEFEEDPHGTLRETERVLVPEGHVVVAGYNAIGLMGAWSLVRRREAPWNGRFYTASRVRDWLSVLGFDTVASEGCFFLPPLRSDRVLRSLRVFEKAGPRFWPHLCGTWFLVARKRTATLTPLRPRWRTRRKAIREAGLAGPAMSGRCPFSADDAA